MSNYPDNFKGIEGEEPKTYIFEIGGEVKVEGYTEEGAEDDMDSNYKELLAEAFRRGDLYIL